jgi:FKBP-type peptidyl-prolyl cis-trans isomerase
MAAISSEHETQDDTDTFSRRQAAQVLATTMAVPLGAAHAESYIKKAGMKGQTNLDVADYTMTASGVQIKKAKEGKGDRTVKDGDTVTVDMTGRLAGKNGLYFIKTTEADGEPITLRLGPGLIPGLREGIEGMKLQEIRRIVVPEELGYTEPLTFPGPQPDPERTDYRERLQSVVNSNSRDGTLVFDVKVVNIR